MDGDLVVDNAICCIFHCSSILEYLWVLYTQYPCTPGSRSRGCNKGGSHQSTTEFAILAVGSIRGGGRSRNQYISMHPPLDYSMTGRMSKGSTELDKLLEEGGGGGCCLTYWVLPALPVFNSDFHHPPCFAFTLGFCHICFESGVPSAASNNGLPAAIVESDTLGTFKRLLDRHMEHTRMTGSGIARSWFRTRLGTTSRAEGPVLCCTVLCSNVKFKIYIVLEFL
ncbi:uncharacterized protein LOC119953367 [Scyliorhinus canicula]|uniref:uncharacterized protein LOC119953367 n=1 Tax=Scyliorhinus canicula TaxID=7830 RepID=UPI0018F299E6|nr:uncharacterized protein LOC119953367 [Scyliorhinus canicula]